MDMRNLHANSSLLSVLKIGGSIHLGLLSGSPIIRPATFSKEIVVEHGFFKARFPFTKDGLQNAIDLCIERSYGKTIS